VSQNKGGVVTLRDWALIALILSVLVAIATGIDWDVTNQPALLGGASFTG